VVTLCLVVESSNTDKASMAVGSDGGSGVGGNSDGCGGVGVGNSVLDMGALHGVRHSHGGVDRGGVVGGHSLGRVGGVGGVVHMGGLHDLLDRVDLVGGGDRDGPGDGDLIGSGHMLVDNDGALDRDRDMDGDIHGVVLDIQLRDDVGLLGGDDGVGPDGGLDDGLGDSVSGGGAIRDSGGGDGSSVGGGVGDDRGGQGPGLNEVLGGSGYIGAGRLGDGFMPGDRVGMAAHHRDLSGLDHLVSHHTVLHPVLHHGGPGSVGVVSLAHHGRSGHHSGTVGSSYSGNSANMGHSGNSGNSHRGVGGLAVGTGHEG